MRRTVCSDSALRFLMSRARDTPTAVPPRPCSARQVSARSATVAISAVGCVSTSSDRSDISPAVFTGANAAASPIAAGTSMLPPTTTCGCVDGAGVPTSAATGAAAGAAPPPSCPATGDAATASGTASCAATIARALTSLTPAD